jgi:HD superfamily phosphohydrolase
MKDIIRNIEEKPKKKEASTYKFSKTERTTLELVALFHDLGHSSFSHAVEQILMSLGEPSHDEKVLEYLERFKPKIEKIPADFELISDTFKRKTPYYPMIWSLVGADVEDYIIRDADNCAITGGSDVERLKTYAYFDGKCYGLETKAILSLDQHVNFWIFMYMEVYNRKGCALWKGVIRTGVYEAIKMGKIKCMKSMGFSP